MISGTPDKTLGLERLENEIHSFRREVSRGATWFFRERYIDRCRLDPFYILEFKDTAGERGDDTWNEELFQTRYRHLRAVCMTRERTGTDTSYWREIPKNSLIQRLDNFLKMFREDYLQPPGFRGDIFRPENKHDIFNQKKFLFEIRSPRKSIIGVGPKMYAGLGIGAIRGQVTDENGKSIAGAIVELITAKEKKVRKTNADGLFWFSKIPPGKYIVRVSENRCKVQVIREEYFGNAKGWIADQDGRPIEDTEVQLISPDAEIFTGFSNNSGRFMAGPLPPFPYILRIPDHLFSLTKYVYVSDAVIGGVLKSQDGRPVAGYSIFRNRTTRFSGKQRPTPPALLFSIRYPPGVTESKLPDRKYLCVKFQEEKSGAAWKALM
jgi:hypothetical protein